MFFAAFAGIIITLATLFIPGGGVIGLIVPGNTVVVVAAISVHTAIIACCITIGPLLCGPMRFRMEIIRGLIAYNAFRAAGIPAPVTCPRYVNQQSAKDLAAWLLL